MGRPGRHTGGDGTMSRAVPSTYTITYLEMTESSGIPHVAPPSVRHAVMRAAKPPIHYYRYLYDAVGQPWQWIDRKRLSDGQLASIIHDPAVEIYIAYVDGVPAGFAELDFRELPDRADLAYFGLIPDFIGRGMGPWLLHWAIDEMWGRAPSKLTVNTCTLDHPSALPMYQKLGFRPYDRREARFVPLDDEPNRD